MQSNEPIIIIFTGYSVNNTPKVKNLIHSLRNEGCKVFLCGIVKDISMGGLGNTDTRYLYSKGSKQGIVKLLYVFSLTVRLVVIVSFFSKIKKIYAINPISGLIALGVYFLTGKKYIYESHEMIFGLNYPFFRGNWRFFWGCLEKVIIKKSQYFFTTDDFRLKFIRRFYKLGDNSSNYILNVPSRSFTAKEKLENKTNFGFRGQYVISYCGGIIKGRGIESIIKGFFKFKRKVPHSLLLLAGSFENDYFISISALINSIGLANKDVIFTGKLDNDSLIKYMSASDVTFALYSQDSLNNRMCSPNKIFDALNSETYIISTKSFLTNEIVLNNNIGVCLSDISVDEILIALKRCYALYNDNVNLVDWYELKQKFCWESEFDRVKKYIL